MENGLYMLLSVSLSAGRSILSKKTAVVADGKGAFFLSQSLLFLTAAVLLAAVSLPSLAVPSADTLGYGAVYGILLIVSQWMFTLSLKNGTAALCTVIYSLGFLIPTVSGSLFWGEAFTARHGIGLAVAVAVILLTAKSGAPSNAGGRFVPYALIAMTASGGLGIVQKAQQSSPSAGEKGIFLVVAFSVAFSVSLVAFLLCGGAGCPSVTDAVYPAVTGLCFGGANLCNTTLAGRLDSAVFFPVQNISTILLTTLLGLLLFRERLTLRIIGILLLSAAVVLLCGT